MLVALTVNVDGSNTAGDSGSHTAVEMGDGHTTVLVF